MSKYDKKREENIEFLKNNLKDDGRFGRIAELKRRRSLSNKIEVARQGKVDISIKVKLNNGKIRYLKAESKTNGGRLGYLWKHETTYTVYSLTYHRKDSKKAPFVLDDRIYRNEDFLAIMETAGAIKSTNGKNPEPAIQPSNATMHYLLSKNGVPYNKEKTYTEDELNYTLDLSL